MFANPQNILIFFVSRSEGLRKLKILVSFSLEESNTVIEPITNIVPLINLVSDIQFLDSNIGRLLGRADIPKDSVGAV